MANWYVPSGIYTFDLMGNTQSYSIYSHHNWINLRAALASINVNSRDHLMPGLLVINVTRIRRLPSIHFPCTPFHDLNFYSINHNKDWWMSFFRIQFLNKYWINSFMVCIYITNNVQCNFIWHTRKHSSTMRASCLSSSSRPGGAVSLAPVYRRDQAPPWDQVPLRKQASTHGDEYPWHTLVNIPTLPQTSFAGWVPSPCFHATHTFTFSTFT